MRCQLQAAQILDTALGQHEAAEVAGHPPRDLASGPQSAIRRGVAHHLAQVFLPGLIEKRSRAGIVVTPISQALNAVVIVAPGNLADPGSRVTGHRRYGFGRVPLAQQPDDLQVTPLNAVRRSLVAAFQLLGGEVGCKIDLCHANDLGGAKLLGILKAISEQFFFEGHLSMPPPGNRITGAALQGMLLSRAKLNRAVLDRARLSAATLDRANLIGAQLEEALLDRTDLTGARLSGANLRRADLTDARAADLEAEFADFSDARLDHADLSGADLSGAIMAGANLTGTRLCGANLRGADLRAARLGGADLRDAKLGAADLRGADLAGADLRGAYMRLTRLDDANLAGADLTGAAWVNQAQLSRATLDGAVGLSAELTPVHDDEEGRGRHKGVHEDG